MRVIKENQKWKVRNCVCGDSHEVLILDMIPDGEDVLVIMTVDRQKRYVTLDEVVLDAGMSWDYAGELESTKK